MNRRPPACIGGLILGAGVAGCAPPPAQASSSPAGDGAAAEASAADRGAKASSRQEPTEAEAEPLKLAACERNPFDRTEADTGQALRGAWFECERARLYAARIDGPKEFVDTMLATAIDEQKRLAGEVGQMDSLGQSEVQVLLRGELIPAWEVVMAPRQGAEHQAIMRVTKLKREGRGFVLLCVAPEDNIVSACPSSVFEELMTFAVGLPK